TMRVMAWCTEHNVSEIEIFYDYNGIEMWATGAWQANNPATKQYQQYMNEIDVTIQWHKVKSHTGNYWNDVADELAKKAALSNQGIDIEQTETIDPVEILKRHTDGFLLALQNAGITAHFKEI